MSHSSLLSQRAIAAGRASSATSIKAGAMSTRMCINSLAHYLLLPSLSSFYLLQDVRDHDGYDNRPLDTRARALCALASRCKRALLRTLWTADMQDCCRPASRRAPSKRAVPAQQAILDEPALNTRCAELPPLDFDALQSVQPMAHAPRLLLSPRPGRCDLPATISVTDDMTSNFIWHFEFPCIYARCNSLCDSILPAIICILSRHSASARDNAKDAGASDEAHSGVREGFVHAAPRKALKR